MSAASPSLPPPAAAVPPPARVLVTGAAGFLGSHVADALSNAGYEVVLFDRVRSPWRRPDQQEVVGDVCDPSVVSRAAGGASALFHFAAVADLAEARATPRRTLETNILGTLTCLEAAVAAGVERFVFASSIYVFSDKGSFYRTSKRACENLVEDYWDTYSLPYTILRFGSLYGPRAGESNMISRMIGQALQEGRIDYPGSGREVREYLHIRDAAAAAVTILDTPYSNEIIHVTGHERMTTREVMEMISEICGGSVAVNIVDSGWQGHYVQTPYSFHPKLGRKLNLPTYIDLGLGLLQGLGEIHSRLNSDADRHS